MFKCTCFWPNSRDSEYPMMFAQVGSSGFHHLGLPFPASYLSRCTARFRTFCLLLQSQQVKPQLWCMSGRFPFTSVLSPSLLYVLFLSSGIIYQTFLPSLSYTGEAYYLSMTSLAAKFMWWVSRWWFAFHLLAENLALCAMNFCNIPDFPK